MAMDKGSITINSLTGDVTASGMAKSAFDILDNAQSYPDDLTGPQKAIAREQLAVIARAIAEVISHVTDNAVVTVDSGIAVTVDPNSGSGSTSGTGTGSVA